LFGGGKSSSTDATKVCCVPNTMRPDDTAASMVCPKCGRGAVYYSHRQLQDGLTHLVFYSAFRCSVCGHRYFRINFLSVSGTVAVLLMLALLFFVVPMVLKQ